MKAILKTVNDQGKRYQSLMFVCPGCASIKEAGTGLHMLPVNTTTKSPSWDWDENLEKPTLSPSIKTTTAGGGVCHSFLREGVFEFLNDSTHKFSGQKVEMVDLPEWATKEGGEHGL